MRMFGIIVLCLFVSSIQGDRLSDLEAVVSELKDEVKGLRVGGKFIRDDAKSIRVQHRMINCFFTDKYE